MKLGKYRAPSSTFKFPFRIGGRSMATGGYNQPTPGRPSKSQPAIKQFSSSKPGRPKPKAK